MSGANGSGTQQLNKRGRFFGVLYVSLAIVSIVLLWHAWTSSIQAIERHNIAVALAAKNSLDVEKTRQLHFLKEI